MEEASSADTKSVSVRGFERRRRILAGLLAWGWAPWLARAADDMGKAPANAPTPSMQAWPARPVRMVVPYAPGGAADPVARLVGERLGSRLGQAVVVENHPGASGNIGAQIVARAVPDGYTLMMAAASTMTINPSLYPNMPFDVATDFAPVGIAAMENILLVANPRFPANTVQEFIALARQRPGTINYASAGSGSGGHLAMELLKSMTGIEVVHVPYKSAGGSLPGLIAGEVQLTFTSAASVLGLVQDGKLKALATASSQRAPILPHVPTVEESGVPGYEVGGWYAILAPGKTPPALVARINAELDRTLAEDAVGERITKMGLTPHTGTPAELAETIRKDTAKWAKVIKNANIKAD